MIILSATLDETIYNLFFPERKIVYHEIEQAAYKGNLIQYPCYSMSRKTINNFIEKTRYIVLLFLRYSKK